VNFFIFYFYFGTPIGLIYSMEKTFFIEIYVAM
jgi:hypothetical protein